VGSCRRDLLDHVILLNERHLKRLMSLYLLYYHEDRTHLGLGKDTPGGRPSAMMSPTGREVMSWPRLGGLHHRYVVAAQITAGRELPSRSNVCWSPETSAALRSFSGLPNRCGRLTRLCPRFELTARAPAIVTAGIRNRRSF